MSVGKEKASSPFEFPAGLRVLAVDDDSTCLLVLAKMLQACGYEVTQCSRAEEALSILREGRSKFDIVISDVHMPDMDGFKLLEIICLEMDLPVVMISADDKNDVVMKGIIDGACDYLVKPVRMEAVKLLWKHVILKQKNGLKVLDQSKNVENAEMHQRQLHDESHLNSMDKENYESSNCKKEDEDEGKDKDDLASLKKPRMVWTAELHQQFVAAVNQIGLTNAVPKKILEIMNVSGLSRENVASHLQKYRLYLRRVDESLPIQQEGQQRSNAIFSSGMPLANQRSFYNCGISESRFGMEQQLSNYKNKQANLSSGVSTMIGSDDQLMPFNQFGQVSGNIDLQISDGTLDRFSSPANANCIYGNFSSSFTMPQRPFKMQKLDENGHKEVFNDGAMCYPVSLSPTVTDFPKGFVAKSSGHDLFPNNSANACYLGNRNSEYTSDSSYAPTHFVEHFDQDDFNIRPYEEQFVGHYEAKLSFDG